MTERTKNFLIGLFVISAAVIGVWILLFLNPSVGDGRQIIQVRFDNIDKVSEGTRVTYSGKPIGEVAGIHLVYTARDEAETCGGPIYAYLLTLHIDSRIKIYTSDEIAVRTSGLLGERSIAIFPRAPKPGHHNELITKDVIVAATPSSSLEEIITTLDRGHFWKNLSDTSKNVKEITKALNNQKALSETVTNVQQFSDSLRRFTEKLDKKWTTLERTIDDAAATLDNLHTITTKVRKGEGTVGKLLYDDRLYLQVSSILTKGETLMNDINHYGILFHLNKTWQRQRTKRMSEVNELSTATQFRNYFNEEMDQMSTSLSRVSTLMEHAEAEGQQGELLYDRTYTSAFKDLLQRVTEVEEKLKLYNAQLNSPEGMPTPPYIR